MKSLIWIGLDGGQAIFASAKDGTGIADILEAIYYILYRLHQEIRKAHCRLLYLIRILTLIGELLLTSGLCAGK